MEPVNFCKWLIEHLKLYQNFTDFLFFRVLTFQAGTATNTDPNDVGHPPKMTPDDTR